MRDIEWESIVLNIQHIITLAGANPDEADKILLAELTGKLKAYSVKI